MADEQPQDPWDVEFAKFRHRAELFMSFVKWLAGAVALTVLTVLAAWHQIQAAKQQVAVNTAVVEDVKATADTLAEKVTDVKADVSKVELKTVEIDRHLEGTDSGVKANEKRLDAAGAPPAP